MLLKALAEVRRRLIEPFSRHVGAICHLSSFELLVFPLPTLARINLCLLKGVGSTVPVLDVGERGCLDVVRIHAVEED